MGDEEDVVMNVCISVPVRIEHELFRMWLDGTTGTSVQHRWLQQ